MTATCKKIIESAGFFICPFCKGEGEIGYFCGHESSTNCYMCGGKGVIKSLKKQKNKKTCDICGGRGGLGCCDNKGFHEWESFELVSL
jgi:DnaJ-class molecular chaperone